MWLKLFNPMIFSFLSISMKTKAKIASAIALSVMNFLKLPYESFRSHIDSGMYGPMLNGSSSLRKDFRLLKNFHHLRL